MKYVYLLRNGEDLYKVGVASDVERRVRGMQTSNPHLIEIIATKLLDNAETVEQAIHDYLKAHKANGGTEWFKLTESQVIEVMVLVNKYPTVKGLGEQITLMSQLAHHEARQKAIESKLNLIIDFASKLEPKQLPVEIKTKKLESKESVDYTMKKKIEEDELMERAIKIVNTEFRASTSLLQRRLSIGYGRAARVMERLEEAGIIGPHNGARARSVNVR